MNDPRFSFRLATGEVTPPAHVQGAGGVLRGADAAHVVRQLIERASAGKALTRVVEPHPGHVLTMQHRAHGDDGHVAVDIRGATLVTSSG